MDHKSYWCYTFYNLPIKYINKTTIYVNTIIMRWLFSLDLPWTKNCYFNTINKSIDIVNLIGFEQIIDCKRQYNIKEQVYILFLFIYFFLPTVYCGSLNLSFHNFFSSGKTRFSDSLKCIFLTYFKLSGLFLNKQTFGYMFSQITYLL